ncbi:MAG: DUF2239 family protein, partial [Candidatus Melainabacteria bacterium]|nr:DUF2239 family protein [Candidatus Melainabacteria bacterium]
MGTVSIHEKTCTAFAGSKIIATGDLKHVAQITKKTIDGGEKEFVLIFDDTTAQPIEIDFRGTSKDVIARIEDGHSLSISLAAIPSEDSDLKSDEGSRGPGRPKLGVVAREVTLLPRHWEWLNSQPGGASVALRKLIDEARHTNACKATIRESQEAAYRFMSAMAGNLPGFEESARALFAGNETKFHELTSAWPEDVGRYAQKLAAAALRQRS